MSRRRTSWRVSRAVALAAAGLLALTGCNLSVYDLPLPGGADLGDDPYQVTIEFRDVLDLVPQSAVKVDDVTVGKVDDVSLKGYTAVVKVLVRDDVTLPDNAVAKIRQTSLLGEKFVSLETPTDEAPTGRLGDGDRIPLDRSGRNPEVEEVLGALSLMLNGGGVAQLKTIASELNKAFDGRESSVRSVLRQLDTFMTTLDDNKSDLVEAMESLNELAVELRKQTPAIKLALRELPQGLAAVDAQRTDLVRMLEALADLSTVGTQVIRDSKAATIDSLNALAPTLTKLAEAGDSFPRSLQVFLTYPFVDAVVGEDPQQARNLHMGDYTNLSIKLEADLGDLLGGKLPGLPPPPPLDCSKTPLAPLCDAGGPVVDTLTRVEKCLRSADPTSKACQDVSLKKLREECLREKYADNPVCQVVTTLPELPGGELPSLPGLPGPGLPTLPALPGLFRTGFGPATDARPAMPTDYDRDLAPLLVWGLMAK